MLENYNEVHVSRGGAGGYVVVVRSIKNQKVHQNSTTVSKKTDIDAFVNDVVKRLNES
jgi:hypothetical protein